MQVVSGFPSSEEAAPSTARNECIELSEAKLPTFPINLALAVRNRADYCYDSMTLSERGMSINRI